MKVYDIVRHEAFVPSLIFICLSALLAFTLTISNRQPRIAGIAPEIGVPGGVLVIKGSNFGSSRSGASVTIAGARPTTTSYIEWSDSRISVQIPSEVVSGLVSVTTRSGTSNGILFTNRNLIPVVVSEQAAPGVPYVESVKPEQANIGSLVTLSGLNFGLSRGDGRVLFTALPTGDEGDGADLLVAASELDFDYESWTEQTVRVRVPDGASSGTIRVVTDRGESNALFFEVVRIGGTKNVRNKRGFQIAYSIVVDNVVAAPSSSLDLWAPGPIETPAQRSVEAVTNPQPVWNDYLGITRFQLSEFVAGGSHRVDLTWWLSRYALETSITPTRVLSSFDTSRRLYRVYTLPEEGIPSDHESIVLAAASVAGRETNPYLAARAIFRFLISQMTYDRKSDRKSVLDAFISARGDAQEYALLLCAMLRSRGIPARPVTGILVYDIRRTIRHVWAEFYLEGFGWVPVDPVLGDGVRFGDFPRIESPDEFYFGGLDEQRIIFTRGVVDIASSMEGALSGSTLRRLDSVASLQTVHERASRGVESYRTLWSQVEIIDFW